MAPEGLLLNIVQQRVRQTFPQSMLKIKRYGFIFSWSRIVCDATHAGERYRVTVRNKIFRSSTEEIARSIIEAIKREINVP